MCRPRIAALTTTTTLPPCHPTRPRTRSAPLRFVEASDIDLAHAQEVLGCCSVRYERRPLLTGWLSAALAIVLLGAFGIVLAAVVRVRAAHAPHLARVRSRSDRSMSGGLPKWSSGGSMSHQLPR